MCHSSMSSTERPASAAPAAMFSRAIASRSSVRQFDRTTPSATRPAMRCVFGPSAAIHTGTGAGSGSQCRPNSAPCHSAVSPGGRALHRDGVLLDLVDARGRIPMLRSALSPDARPRRKRPSAICCTEADAEAATAAWRVIGFDTVIARSGRVVSSATNVINEKHSAHSDCESPVVSMSKPEASASRSQRR